MELATRDISGEKNATTSIIIPLIYNLENSLKAIAIEPSNTIATNLKTNLLAEISRRLGAAEQVQLLATAMLLDPRFKKIYFKDILNCEKTVDYINNMIQNQTFSPKKGTCSKPSIYIKR